MKQATVQIGHGTVRHRRLRPVEHAFDYPACFVLLPLRSWQGGGGLTRNRFGLLAFHDRDHGDGGADALAWFDALLAAEGIHDALGEVWLQTFPRVLGLGFRPVSFWFAHRADGGLAAIVAEVNNTFGERHCYLLAGPELAYGRELQARKVFHVSPFCRVQGHYRFRFHRDGERTLARIDLDDDEGPLLQTSVHGRLRPLTVPRAWASVAAAPVQGLAVILRIHWQALRLWLRRVPFHGKPAPPAAFTTREPSR